MTNAILNLPERRLAADDILLKKSYRDIFRPLAYGREKIDKTIRRLLISDVHDRRERCTGMRQSHTASREEALFSTLNGMQIGFIGAGRAGVSLGKYFKEKGCDIGGYYSRSLKSARWAAEFTQTTFYESLQEIISRCDMLFFTVPDSAIEEVARQASPYLTGRIVSHCSGLHSSHIFSDIGSDCSAYSIHPLFAISSRENSWRELSDVLFAIEGDDAYIHLIEKMFHEMGNRTRILSAGDKVKYHAAAALSSNYMTTLIFMAQQLFMECGFTETEAKKELYALAKGNLDHILDQGCAASLTGPLERNDLDTIGKHLKALNPDMREVYRKNAEYLISLARIKHPDRDYTAMENLCGGR